MTLALCFLCGSCSGQIVFDLSIDDDSSQDDDDSARELDDAEQDDDTAATEAAGRASNCEDQPSTSQVMSAVSGQASR